MVPRTRLLTGVLVLAMFSTLGSPTAARAAAGCSLELGDTCTDISVGNGGSGIDVGVTTEQVVGGSDAPASDSASGDSGWSGDAPGAVELPAVWRYDPITGKPIYARTRAPRGTTPAAPAPATLPTVIQSTDVANVAPKPGTLTTEPNGWAIMNTPMNAYVTATNHTATSTINSIPVTVTFTPESYEWTWGDGTVTTTEVPGDSWANLGQPNWSETATSHSYSERGTITLSVRIKYSATVSANGKTIPVTGLVTGPATSSPILVVRSDAALVANNCIDAPHDPGC